MCAWVGRGEKRGWCREAVGGRDEELMLCTSAYRLCKGFIAHPPSLVCTMRSCSLKIKGLQGLKAEGPPFSVSPANPGNRHFLFPAAPWGWGGGGGADYSSVLSCGSPLLLSACPQ